MLGGMDTGLGGCFCSLSEQIGEPVDNSVSPENISITNGGKLAGAERQGLSPAPLCCRGLQGITGTGNHVTGGFIGAGERMLTFLKILSQRNRRVTGSPMGASYATPSNSIDLRGIDFRREGWRDCPMGHSRDNADNIWQYLQHSTIKI